MMDLLHDLCTDIQPALQTALPPLPWKVDTITTAKRIPFAATTPINPFEGIVPTGWLLFEMGSGWHFWPAKTLLVIVRRAPRCCLFTTA